MIGLNFDKYCCGDFVFLANLSHLAIIVAIKLENKYQVVRCENNDGRNDKS